MKDYSADQLHIEVPHARGANTRFAHCGERFREELIQYDSLAFLSLFLVLCIANYLLHAFLKLRSACSQFIIRELLYRRFKRIDLVDYWLNRLQESLIVTAKNFR